MNCPNCNAEIPNEATVCPSCSHELAPVVGASTSEEPKASSRPGWLVFAGVGAVVLAIGAAAFAFSGRGAGADLSDRIPADAFVYVEVDIEALMSDEVKEVVAAFGPLVEAETGEEFDVDAWFDEIIDSFDVELAGNDMSYEEDIASWASRPVAIGVLGEAGEPDVVAVVGGRDSAALDAFLGKVEAEADGTEEIAGVRFLTTSEDGQQMYIGRVGDDLVATSDAALAETMVSGPAETLADDSGFTSQLAAVQDSGIVVVAVDSEKATELSQAGAPMAPMMLAGPDVGDFTTGWVVSSFGVVDGNIRADYAATVTDEFPRRQADPAVEEALPADTIAFSRIGYLIDQLALFGESGVLDGMEDAYGITLAELVGLFSVDGAIGVWPSTQPEIPINAAVVALSDSNQSATVAEIADLAETLGWNVADQSWGYTIERLVGLGTRDALTFLTTDDSLIQSAPESSFASSDLHRRASALVDGDLALAIDTPAVIDLIDGFVGMEDPEAAETLACLPIGVIAVGIEVSGDDIRGSSVVEITDPC